MQLQENKFSRNSNPETDKSNLRSFLAFLDPTEILTAENESFERSVESELNPEKPSVVEEPRNGLDEREEAMAKKTKI